MANQEKKFKHSALIHLFELSGFTKHLTFFSASLLTANKHQGLHEMCIPNKCLP